MKFIHNGKPTAKRRHRTSNGRTYDPQYNDKMKLKWDFANQFRQQGYLKASESPIYAKLDIRCPIPKSWPQKRKKEAVGKFVTSKPDSDNYEKYYFDVLNKIAYKDDAQIACISSQKTYSENPGVSITLIPLEESMVNEHAILLKDKPSIDDMYYLIKKANRLGLSDRQIMGVYKEEKEDGTHVYFSVEGMKGKK